MSAIHDFIVRSPGRARRVSSLSASLLLLAAVQGCGEETHGASTGGTGGSMSTTTSAGGTGGDGGGGAGGTAVDECSSPNDCPDPGSECVVRLCFDHKCGTQNAPYGTPLKSQTDGDCQLAVCDGDGATTAMNDNADVKDDGVECTKDACSEGKLTHDPLSAGSACSQGGGKLCDPTGACVGCIADKDCAAGSLCASATCVAPSCVDGAKNGDESDTDCGGSCAKCDVSKACATNKDCGSALCVASLCAATKPIITAVSMNGHDRAFGVALDAQGNIFTTGVVAPGTDTMTDYSTVVTKYTPQGVLDTTFGAGGFAIKNLTTGTNGELSRGIVLQSTGKIVVSATVEHAGAADARDRDIAVARFNADGSLDSTFGTGGVTIVDLSPGQLVGTSYLADSAWALVVLPDDRLVVSAGMVRPGGMDTDYAMVRFTANGAVDSTFGDSGVLDVDYNMLNATGVRSLSLLPDGSLIGAGYLSVNSANQPFLYKATTAGKLDPAFGMGGIFTQSIPSLAAQAETYMAVPQGNKLVTTGYGRNSAASESLDWVSLRFLANGTLDSTYGTGGVARIDIGGYNDNSRYLLVLPDNRVVLVGGGRLVADDVNGAVGVLTPNGQPDTTFSPTGVKMFDLGGVNDFLWAAALGPSGKYLVLSGIDGVANGAAGDDDSALVLVPLE